MSTTEFYSQLPAVLRAGQGVFAAWVGIADVQVTEALLRAGFDCAVLDMQHGAFDFDTVSRSIAVAALAGKPTVVRMPVGEYQTLSRVLDAGAAGVIAPMINSVADARALASFCKFPPLGQRSWGPRRVLDIGGFEGKGYLATANTLHQVFAMIETREALDTVEDILAVAGIDGVFVGPSDLSIALSGGAAVDPLMPEVEAALDHVARAARAAGKHAGLFTFDGAKARSMVRRGFSFCSIATDGLLLARAARLELAAARAAG